MRFYRGLDAGFRSNSQLADLDRKGRWHRFCFVKSIQPWSVVIPDEKAESERLQSIATLQKRLQVLLDEGRLLRQSLEVMSAARDFPEPSVHRNSPFRRPRGAVVEGGSKKDDGKN